MNRILLLSFVATAVAGGHVSSYLNAADPPVDLQPTTPGTPQTGHINVTGTILSQFMSATSGEKNTSVISGFATSQGDVMIAGDFRNTSTKGVGARGLATATTGATYGGAFGTSSSEGTGVLGVAGASTGINFGGDFSSASPDGFGVRGISTPGFGKGIGVYGQANSSGGHAGFFEGRVQVTGAFQAATLAGSGTGLTDLSATNITSGVLADARIAGTIARRNATNIFTSPNFFNQRMFIGPRTAPIGTNEMLGLSSFTTGLAGMYVSTGTGGKPYYGYDNGAYRGYSYLNSAGELRFFNSGADVLSLTRQGKIANGSFTPNHKVDVRGDEISDKKGILRVLNGTEYTFPNWNRTAAWFQAHGNAHTSAVLAEARSTSNSTTALGAYASGTNFTNIGIYGHAAGAPTNYAIYASGLLYAVTSSAGVKSFVIDHPLDPENKLLEHSSIESDERMNIYRGVVTTDSRGYATVTVPAWFSALNEDIQYQLTVVDTEDSASFTQVKVVQKISGSKFKIRTSTPTAEVNWQVSGRRHDPTSQHLPLQVERDKQPHERGRYLVPQAYGKDESYEMVPGRGGAQQQGKEPPAGRNR